ncbi:MAG: prolyl oligopeptidase family serine peptidase [Bacteroidota bacterium]
MLIFRLLLLLSLLTAASLSGQRALEIEDLETWNRIQSVSINASGSHTAYVLRPDKGDPITVLTDNYSGKERRFTAADRPQFNYAGTHLLLMQHPTEAVIRQFKKDDKAKQLAEMDSLVVIHLRDGTQEVFPAVKRVAQGEKWADFYAYTTTSVLADSLQKGLAKKSNRLVIKKYDGTDSLSLEGVTQFSMARDQPALLAQVAAHDSLWTDAVRYLGTDFNWQILLEQKGTYAQLSLSPNGERAAFLGHQDTTENKQVPFQLYTWSRDQPLGIVVPKDASWLPKYYRVSDDGKLNFSDSGNKLYFGIAAKQPEPDTSLLDEDMADVEVWTTQDRRMYTQENVRLKQEQKRTYRCVYNWPQRKITQLASPERAEIAISEKGDNDWILLYDERAYLPRLTWIGGPSYKDLYLKNTVSGEEINIATEMRGTPQWSPAGKYLTWYSYPDTAWFAYDLAAKEVRQITDNATVAYYEETNDRPMLPWAYGYAGWMENDDAMVVYDRYDWWRIDPSGQQKAKRITNVRADKKRLRYLSLDPDKRFFKAGERVLVSHFDEDSYHEGYAWLDLGSGAVRNLMAGPYDLGRPQKARKAEQYVFTRGDFQTFPDLRLADFSQEPATLKSKKISTANPQQKNFAWGSAESFSWVDNQGRQLRGILVKPPNFDPNKKYPLLVNFYERSSEGVYRHRAPYPHRSTINYSYYASRGYVIFNPDVIYRKGYPGESAYDCVMSGVTALLALDFIEASKIGVQGHSWGGYQVAHLVTKTNLFACAESGAPVVNMFSAYGGIRWGSGLSRQFQYEQTQSRIGGTIWEYPLRYLENSPLFFTDKVETPLLIMHNDKDGAVPWYQGIEYFTALRRLGKPAWMLNYRGEPHWPLKQANRVDFQRRMSQFFDHYLMDAPQPAWMKEGVSPLRRGIEQGYETRE